ncbi:MAG: hypothetical protein HYX69_00440 [Planctomycetia bacterium]|nr:hypothetical protein [Planctomycetia bacterium]
MEILVLPGGLVRCLYDEAIDLAELGRLTIVRASHVEPDADGNWYADLAPVGGPKLGPYARRSDALAAEQKWLEANHICRVHCEGAAPV